MAPTIARRTPILAAGLLVAMLAGCTGHSAAPGGAGGGPAQSATANQGSDTGRTMRFQLAAVGYPAVAASLPGQPLGTSGSAISGLDLEVWLLQRSGSHAMLVVFALHNPGSERVPTGITAAALSANHNSAGSTNTVSGVSAVDGSGLKQYLPFMVRPGDDQTCVCSDIQLNDYGPGERDYYAALLAAPPSDVRTLTVVTGLGSVPNVPLS